MQEKLQTAEIDCQGVRRQLVDYMEDDLAPDQRSQIERHLADCRHCTAVYDGVHNVVQLVGDGRAISVPAGFGQRLHKRFLSGVK